MPVHISDVMQEFAKSVRKILGNSLDSVIVYGSYARGGLFRVFRTLM